MTRFGFPNEKGFFAQAFCTAEKDLGNHQVELTLEEPRDKPLNKPLAVPADAKADNPNRCGRGFKILNCHLEIRDRAAFSSRGTTG